KELLAKRQSRSGAKRGGGSKSAHRSFGSRETEGRRSPVPASGHKPANLHRLSRLRRSLPARRACDSQWSLNSDKRQPRYGGYELSGGVSDKSQILCGNQHKEKDSREKGPETRSAIQDQRRGNLSHRRRVRCSIDKERN